MDELKEVEFPQKGIDLSTELESQIPGTTPIGNNVRVVEALGMRARGGSREGLSKYINQQVSGKNKIQHLNYIVDPTTNALVANDEGAQTDAVVDPSTNNKKVRNPAPGRRVRNGGSARMPNLHIKGKSAPAGGMSANVTFTAWVTSAVGGGVHGLQTDNGQAGAGFPYNKTLNVSDPSIDGGFSFAVTCNITVDAHGAVLTHSIVSVPAIDHGFLGAGNYSVSPI